MDSLSARIEQAGRAVSAAPADRPHAAVFTLDAVLPGAPDDLGADGTAEERAERGVAWFRQGGAAGLRYEAWVLARRHARAGQTVILVSPGPREVAEPVAAELGAVRVLTGGDALAQVRGALAELGVAPADTFAYAAQARDGDLLDAVGHPVALGPDAALGERARAQGWLTVVTASREAGRVGAARTAACYGTFLGATGVGLATGLLARRRRTGVDAMTRTFGRLAPAIAGVRIDLQGGEHLHSHRPAVFVINHQSSLVDAIVTFRLLGAGFSPVAKREVRAIPLLGPATALADWAYVSRVGDPAQARTAVADAVAKLRGGVSVILAPEGTRSIGPTPGPFKKGGFYMARDAGVPVVPIVMRNSGELMWRAGRALSPGTVEVAVLPPISCDWTDAEFGERVEDVRRLYIETLTAWPG